MAGVMFVQTPIAADAATKKEQNETTVDAEQIFKKEDVDQLIRQADRQTVKADTKGKQQTSAFATRSFGNTTPLTSYPTRKGVIMVTPDSHKGIPLGHAAIVYKKDCVVEATFHGITTGANNWDKTRKKVYGVTVNKTTDKQDEKAADWCYEQVGKLYNFNYFNTKTRKKFYCSQLVYAAYLDNYNIDLNTSAWNTILGNPIHPMELVTTSQTTTIYRKGDAAASTASESCAE